MKSPFFEYIILLIYATIMKIKNKFTDELSNFIASIVCYVGMPLTPFIFEYCYTSPSVVSKRSVMIATSAYAFSLAFGTKFRVMSIIMISNAFLIGGMYGSVKVDELAKLNSLPCVNLYILILLAIFEWGWRSFGEQEKCWFYTIFQSSSTPKT